MNSDMIHNLILPMTFGPISHLSIWIKTMNKRRGKWFFNLIKASFRPLVQIRRYLLIWLRKAFSFPIFKGASNSLEKLMSSISDSYGRFPISNQVFTSIQTKTSAKLNTLNKYSSCKLWSSLAQLTSFQTTLPINKNSFRTHNWFSAYMVRLQSIKLLNL